MSNAKENICLPILAIRESMMPPLASSSIGENLTKQDGEYDCKNNITYTDNGIAIIHVDGTLSYRSSFWQTIFGGDSYDSIRAAFEDTLNDNKVKGILFDINSPGGEVSGVADLADEIYNARGRKPYGIVARTGGIMCSAAYWIGSACEKVYTASNGTLGSIGVLCSYDKNNSDYSIITSDLSPDKAPSPDTKRGLSLIKKELNDLAEVFINAVAKNRNTTSDDVKENYGKGSVFIGQKAVEANLSDGVFSLDEVMAKMTSFKLNNGATMAKKEDIQAVEPKQPSAEEIGKEAIANYKKEIQSVKALFDKCGVKEDASAFVDEGKTLADAKEYAFNQMQENLKVMAEIVIAKDNEIAALKDQLSKVPAACELSKEQKLAIQKGLEADSKLSNMVEGGVRAEDTESKAITAAFVRGFNK